MPRTSTAFDDHLTAGETPVTDGSAVLFEETRWTPAAICVTDRRICFVTDGGGFVDVDRGQVLSIRSRPTTRRANRAVGAQVTAIGGVVLTVLAAGALLAGASSTLVPLLALFAAVGTVAAGGLAALETGMIARGEQSADGDASRPSHDVGLGARHVEAAADRIDASLERAADALAGTRIDDATGAAGRIETVDVHRRYERPVGGFVEQRPLSLWFAGAVALAGAAGLVALDAWIPLGLTAAAVAGIGLAAYGLGRRRALDDGELTTRRERSVCLYVLGGRTVRFRIDADADIDRELSRLTVGRPALPRADAPGVPAPDRSPEQGTSSGR